MPIERVNGQLLRRIFEDQKVLAGLEKAIDVTREKGLETGFPVYKKAFTDLYFPSDHVEVGSPSSAGGNIGSNYAEELFRKETGKDPFEDNNAEEYCEFCIRQGFHMDFIGPNRIMTSNDYPLINFHIRREGRKGPSNSDLIMLKQCMEVHPYSRPVYCIVSSEENHSKSHDLFLFQAKVRELDELDLQRAKDSLDSCSKLEPDVGLIVDGFLGVPTQFSIGYGKYERRNKRFVFNQDLGKFCYKIDWRARR
ncbi:hypothetical protein J4218_06705 [Candidatus Pacearchaeota archaeon]|nr:hypothetical protein [Candidatus Pacearchaeota archaeon]